MNLQRLIHEKELLVIIGVSRSTIDRWVKAGNFPPARELTPNRKAWRETDIEKWIDSRPIAGRAIHEIDNTTKQLNGVFKK